MTYPWNRRSLAAALGVAGMLTLTVAGCGGGGQKTDDAVVITDPSATVPTPGATGGATAAPATTGANPSGGTGSAPAAASPTTSVKAEGWGTLKGQITFNGNPPAPKVLAEPGKASKDPEVCAKDTPIKSERLVVDDATKGVKNVLVYFPKATPVNPEAKSAAMSSKLEYDQKNCTFIPHVLGVMVGSSVELKNSDPVNHNINSRLRQNSFNPVIPGNQSSEKKIDTVERTPGEIVCDIHPWMKGYWMVLDNPYFAVTDAKGNFEIKNVPAGTQKVVVWQEAVGFVTPGSGDPVNIKANDTTTMDVKIDAAKVKPE